MGDPVARRAVGRDTAVTSHSEVLEAAARSFLDALRVRDFPRVAGCFSADAHARMLLPGGLEERDGGAAIAGEVERWFGSADLFEVVHSTTSVVVDRFQLAYRLKVGQRDDDTPLQVIEQHAFGDATPDGIEVFDLVCSGFRPLLASESHVHVFDAGAMGCTDGLAPEFRRRIRAIPAGDVLRVIVQDPSAKEDLPPLARMLGHTVQTVDTLGDGRVQITVERST
jgi:TusA-related sulfurtransferase